MCVRERERDSVCVCKIKSEKEKNTERGSEREGNALDLPPEIVPPKF